MPFGNTQGDELGVDGVDGKIMSRMWDQTSAVLQFQIGPYATVPSRRSTISRRAGHLVYIARLPADSSARTPPLTRTEQLVLSPRRSTDQHLVQIQDPAVAGGAVIPQPGGGEDIEQGGSTGIRCRSNDHACARSPMQS